MPTITSHNLPFAYRGTPIRQLASQMAQPSPAHMARARASSYSISMSIFNSHFPFSHFHFHSRFHFCGNRIGRFRLPALNRLRQLMVRVSATMSAIFSCLKPHPPCPLFPPISTSNVGSVIDAAPWADIDNSVKWAELLCSCERS